MPIHESGTMIAGRYEVVQGPREKPSLAGGMGLVYLCVDHGQSGLPVALKTFQPQLLSNRRSRDLFLREGTTWVELGKHPHIVRCHEVITETVGQSVFFVLELVAAAEGKDDASLRSRLGGKALEQKQALRLALQLAHGMQHATTKIPDLVHRDLKPENILVGRVGRARITDFGLVQAMQEASSKGQIISGPESESGFLHRTQLSHGVAGTPAYMAPEQWQPGKLTAATDIYAFGCILYEMLTGRMAQVRIKDAYELSLKFPADLSSVLKAFLLRCLAPEVEQRFATWAEATQALASVYASLTGMAYEPVSVEDQETKEERLARGWSFNAMGLSYQDIGKFKVAQQYFDNVLKIARTEHDQRLEAAALGNLGDTYRRLGDARCAIKNLEQHLIITRELGDRRGEGEALGMLGVAYRQLGNARAAIACFEQHQAFAHELGDRRGECHALGNLGIVYGDYDESRRAIECHEQVLAIMREIGDRHGEGVALGNLGIAIFQLGDARSSLGYFEQYLAIAREIGDRHGEGTALGNLGFVFFQLGDIRRAIEHLEIGQRIKREIGDTMGLAETSFNLARALVQQRKIIEARQHANSAYRAFVEMGHAQYAEQVRQFLLKLEGK